MSRKRRSFYILLVMVIFVSLGSVALAQGPTIKNFSPSKDNTLYEDNFGDISNGVGLHFFAGQTDEDGGVANDGEIRRGVIAFDISSIPAGSTIISATLNLQLSKTQAGNQIVTLHKLTADWGEGASNASLSGEPEEGQGTAAQTGDATWLHRSYITTAWTTPGGDFVATASATQTVGTTTNVTYSWSSDQMKADVQSWLDTPASNYGWLVKGTEGTDKTTKRFFSKDHTTASVRPVLAVTYQEKTTAKSIYLPLILKPYEAKWTAQNSSVTKLLRGVSCPTTSFCVAVGADGWILTTNDAGTNWITRNSGTTNLLKGVDCPTTDFCVAVGDGPTILVSTNQGQSWTNKSTGSNLYAVGCSTDKKTCLAGGVIGNVALTIDGGNGWTPGKVGNTDFHAVDCPDPSGDLCYAVGSGRVTPFINKTVQLGSNVGVVNHYGISCPTNKLCYMVSDKGEIRKTTDGSATWSSLTSGTTDTLRAVSCSGSNDCITVGGATGKSTALKSANGGTTWTAETLPVTNKFLYGVSCPTDSFCVAVGEGGTIIAKK